MSLQPEPGEGDRHSVFGIASALGAIISLEQSTQRRLTPRQATQYQQQEWLVRRGIAPRADNS